MPQDQYSAFISYASVDQKKAGEICASLESRGLACWIAPRNIRAGHEYGDEIIEGIQQSRCLVLVLSEAANQSPFVRREVERAVSKRKPVFPVRIEDILPSPSLELFVSATHWIDAWDGRMVDHIDRLARDLGDVSAPGRAVPLPQKNVRRQVPKWALAGAAFVAVVAAIVAGESISRKVAQPQQPPPQPTTTPFVMPTFTVPPIKTYAEMHDEMLEKAYQQTEKNIASAGVALQVVSAPKGETAPAVYESFPSKGGFFQFVPLCPPDTAVVKYSFDTGDYFTLDSNPNVGATIPHFAIEDWSGGNQFRMLLESKDGKETGPFIYTVPEKEAFVLKQLKAAFLARLPTAMQCALVPAIKTPATPTPQPSPSPSPTASPAPGAPKKTLDEEMTEIARQNRENAERSQAQQAIETQISQSNLRLTVDLREKGYDEVANLPAVVCAPTHGSPIVNWAVVKEIRIGSSPDALGQTVPVKIDWAAFLKKGKTYFTSDYQNAKVLQACMPADAGSIYVKFVFRDGTESDVCRYKVDATTFVNRSDE